MLCSNFVALDLLRVKFMNKHTLSLILLHLSNLAMKTQVNKMCCIRQICRKGGRTCMKGSICSAYKGRYKNIRNVAKENSQPDCKTLPTGSNAVVVEVCGDTQVISIYLLYACLLKMESRQFKTKGIGTTKL